MNISSFHTNILLHLSIKTKQKKCNHLRVLSHEACLDFNKIQWAECTSDCCLANRYFNWNVQTAGVNTQYLVNNNTQEVIELIENIKPPLQ